MKILYGVQGTGNGHLTRSRVMAKHFAEAGADVTYLFSGRAQNNYFGMEAFGMKCLYRRGLTFTTDSGKIRYFKTVLDNNLFQMIRDIRKLDVSTFDLIITDFEPITAWAGKLAGKPVLGVGHQFAFDHQIPLAGENPVAKLVMKFFAPAGQGLGLHWHHFNQAILPPIVDTMDLSQDKVPGKVLVYLPFEDHKAVIQLLQTLTSYEFYLYVPDANDEEHGNVHVRKTNLTGFQKDLHDTSAVICNSGFELVSECLQLGTKVLVKPLNGQMEQLSNAAALRELNYGSTMPELNKLTIENWLKENRSYSSKHYPDVAKAIVQWVLSGQQGGVQHLASRLWSEPPIL